MPTKKTLSKTKLLAFRQCPRRLWLEVHRPDLREDSGATQASFEVGHTVGEVARRLYDPAGRGTLVDPLVGGRAKALALTRQLLAGNRPIFEAGFAEAGALAFADILMPMKGAGPRRWRMVEVKSATSVKDYHRDDAAIQSFVARAAGVPLARIALAYVDSGWVYPGGEDYRGLLVEEDLTKESFARNDEVRGWIEQAQSVASRRREPEVATGVQCQNPYACGFHGHCAAAEPQAEHPIAWLPGARSRPLKEFLDAHDARDMSEVPDALLSDMQRRVKQHTLAGSVYFDAASARAGLAGSGWPAYFMDFETVNFAVPRWAGTRPYQQVPFQFSVHRIASNGRIGHAAHVDLSGDDPSRSFAEALVAACGDSGPVFAYNAGFEKAVLKSLVEWHPEMKRPLMALHDRVRDLLAVARQCYYHPRQQGSFSIKAVLPTVAPELAYDELDGVRDGGMAMEAYRQAVAPDTPAAERQRIERELLDYCALDTRALVRLWQHFSGRRATV